MTNEDAKKWLLDLAAYFEKRPTGGEDMAHWANAANAATARKIATIASAPHPAPDATDWKAKYDEALPWQMFYGEGKTLGEIANHFGKSVYAFSPWLTAPLINSAAEAKTKEALATAQAENEKLREAVTLAANRLARCALDYEHNSPLRYQVREWADDARAALSPPPLSPEKP